MAVIALGDELRKVFGLENRPVPVRLSLSALWILNPPYGALLRFLRERDYTMKPEAGGSPGTALAEKGSVTVYAEFERRIVGVSGSTSPSDLSKGYEELIEIYKASGVDTQENICWHEFIGDFQFKTNNNPMEVLGKIRIGDRLLNTMSRSFGVPTQPFSLAFGLEDGNPGSSKWMDVTIEPMFVSAKDRYHIRAIYRDNLDNTLSFVKNVDDKIGEVVRALESEAK